MVTNPRCEVVERLAGVWTLDGCSLTLSGVGIVLRVLVGDEVNGPLSVHAMLSNR